MPTGEIDRLLSTLARALVEAAEAAEGEGGGLSVRCAAGAVERTYRFGPALLAEARSLGLVAARGPVALTPEGRARLARAADPSHAFLRQHKPLRREKALPGEDDILVDAAESPLAWLRRRRAASGESFIPGHGFEAGERLRAEFTRGNMMPKVTASWDRTATSGRHRAAPSPVHAELVMAARERVRAALRAVGPELSGVLVDVCCFLKGLEQVERERRWPARSGKVVLALALERLAAHYGLAAEARGPASSPLRKWGAPDHRPMGRAASPQEDESGS